MEHQSENVSLIWASTRKLIKLPTKLKDQ